MIPGDLLSAPVVNAEALSTYEGMVQSEANPAFCDPALDFDYLVITNEFLRDASTMDYTMADFVARKEANGYVTREMRPPYNYSFVGWKA